MATGWAGDGAVQQQIDVHGARHPFRIAALAAALLLDGVQHGLHLRHRQCRIEMRHRIDEIGAIEAHGGVAEAGREDNVGKILSQQSGGLPHAALRIDVAAERDENPRYGITAQPRRRSMLTPTSRE